MVSSWLVCLVVLGSISPAAVEDQDDPSPRIVPNRVSLRGQDAHQALIVIGRDEGRDRDWTSATTFRSEDPKVARVGPDGLVLPVADGSTKVFAKVGLTELVATVEVRDAAYRPVPTMERDVQPILTRFGCNAGPCHGKQRGQNGFQLSLLGFDASFDHDAIASEARGRRVFPAAPDQSLILLKATAAVPHGGGRKLEVGGAAYEALRSWIAAGMPRSAAGETALTKITVEPRTRVLAPATEQRLIVSAHFADGSVRDVTDMTAFQSNESAIAAVSDSGLVKTGAIPGEATIMARYRGKFATCDVSIPLAGEVSTDVYESLPRKNFIDGLVYDKWRSLGVVGSETCEDHTFLRRAFIDLIGRLPTPEEARAFLEDASPSKRPALIDALLQRPEYADHRANQWMDLLRPNPYRVGIKAVLNFDAWIRQAFREDWPHDEFARRIITAKGSTWGPSAATMFRDRREPEELTTMVSQLFLGVRLECAKCHHHPFEVYGQDDFYGFTAFFQRVGRKGTGLSPPISGGEEIVFTTTKAKTVINPATGAAMAPKPLFGSIHESEDPRDALASWLTSSENPLFARVSVNRVWAELMGRGLVEPVDDLRATNPAANGPLLDALAQDFRDHGYQLKHLYRTIMTSHVYELSSRPHARNVADTRNHSRHYRRRLRAETLLDAVSDVTGVPEAFDAAPPGTRAAAIWTHRVDSLFLDTFGRPDRNQDPPCERAPEPTVVQALHLMNAPRIHAKITDDQAVPNLLAQSSKTADAIVEDLYLRVYARFPNEEECAIGRGLFDRADTPKARREAAEDLLWALMNTPEFIFKD